MRYLADILRQTFPSAYSHLLDKQALLVALDLLALADEEFISVPHAATLLRQRIGGEANLASYAATLEAGYDLKNK